MKTEDKIGKKIVKVDSKLHKKDKSIKGEIRNVHIVENYSKEDLLNFAYYVYSHNNDMITTVYIKADIQVLFKKWLKTK